MYHNNCRLADDADRLRLATRTLAVWTELRSGSADDRGERHHPHRHQPSPTPARSAVPRGVGHAAAHPVPGNDRPGPRRRRPCRRRLRRCDVRLRRLRALLHRRRSARPRSPRGGARQHRVPRRPTVAARRRVVGSRRPDPRPAGLVARRGARLAHPCVRLVRRSSTGPGDGRPRTRRGRHGVPSAQGPVRSAGAERRPRRGPRDPRRRRRGHRADGRLQPGLADAVGHRCRRGTSSAPPRSRTSSPPSTCTGWRSRCTAATTTGSPNCGGASTSGSPAESSTREPYEFRELLERDCLDVFQPDCVCTQGITGLRRLADDVVGAGKTFTPHTWGNGIGLLANAHLTAGTVGAPFLEFPFDPPEWTTARPRLHADRDDRGRR